MTFPDDSPRSPLAPEVAVARELESLRSASGVQRLADNVEAIRDAYLTVSRDSARQLADRLTALAAHLREPPEGVDPASLVLEVDQLLAEVESRLAQPRRNGA